MSRRASPASREPDQVKSPVQRIAAGFAAEHWRLLVRLPAAVMIAAISVQADTPRRTVAEGLAGLDAIAAGRASDSDLVRAVVAAIYTEADEDRPIAEEFGEWRARQVEVLADCRRAVAALRVADPADAAAYQHWVQHIAVRVCGAGRSGGVLGLGGEQPSPAEREFLNALATAFA